MPIRSKRLSAAVSSGAVTYRVLQLGDVTSVIVKSAHFAEGGGTVGTVALYVFHAAANANVLVATLSLAAFGTAEWNGWIILEDNDRIYVAPSKASIYWWISGTLLQGVIDTTVTPALQQLAPSTSAAAD